MSLQGQATVTSNLTTSPLVKEVELKKKMVRNFVSIFIDRANAILAAEMRRAISTQGRSVGVTWPPLSEFYVTKIKESGNPALVDTEALYNSITVVKKSKVEGFAGIPLGSKGADGQDRAIIASMHEIGYTTPRPYGLSNIGTISVPARPFIAPTFKKWCPKLEKMGTRMFKDFLEGLCKEAPERTIRTK